MRKIEIPETKKISKGIARHGEAVFVPVAEIPAEARLIGSHEQYIACHSETGHHHTLVAKKPFNVYQDSQFTYFELIDTTTLVHEKTGTHVHEPVRFAPGIRRMHRKTQYNPIKKAMEAVRD